jgi:hypothetical protein
MEPAMGMWRGLSFCRTTDRAGRLGTPAGLAAALALGAGAAGAGLVDTAYPLGSAAGTWQVDRYAPAQFANGGTLAGRADVLSLGVAAADGPASRPPSHASSFYNTQGRGLVLNLPAYAVVYGSLYLPAAWAASGGAAENRRTDLWAQASPATGGDSCVASGCNHFPYVGFSNASPADPLNAGGTGRFRVFDSTVGVVDLATPVPYDQWSDVCLAYTGSEFRSFINGALVYTQADLTHNDVATLGPTTHFSRMLLQAYNFGSTYTAQWAGLGAGQLGSVGAQGGGGQTAAPGSAFAAPLAVQARDSSGAPLPCVPVTFSAPGSGASATLASVTVLTDRAGIAAVQATANGELGDYAVSAAAPGLAAPAVLALRNAVVAQAPAEPVPVGGGPWLLGASLALWALARGRRRA